MTPTLDRDAVRYALKDVINTLDYDLWKELEEPEDEDSVSWDELVDIFIDTYEGELQ